MGVQLGKGTFNRNKNKYQEVDGKWEMFPDKKKHPDYTGKIKLKVGGGEIDAYVSGWMRKKDGKSFMSLAIEYPQQESRRLVIATTQKGTKPPAPVAKNEPLPDVPEEDLPFCRVGQRQL